jgi:hypothetical protein
MTGRDAIELRSGSSAGLRAGHRALSVLALAAILSSAADPMWIMMAVCALGAACLASNRMTRSSRGQERLLLRADGTATVHSANGAVMARLSAGAWVSRWCSVMTLEELLSGRRCRYLICRSRNSQDDYRRLLVNLRMDSAHAPDGAVTRL